VPVIEERKIASLVSHCVELISNHIDDVEALGDLGAANMEAIAKAICRNRTLSPENVMLFHDVNNTSLFLHDVTRLPPPALITMANLNPNLRSLRLDYCGLINDEVLTNWAVSLPHLKRIELLGPFLVTPKGWTAFFEGHSTLEAFLITQSPRFDRACLQSLLSNCGAALSELRLKEVGKLNDNFLVDIAGKTGATWTHLDLSAPAHSCSEEALSDLVHALGGKLLQLDLSGHVQGVTDAFLNSALVSHAASLTSLRLSGCTELTDGGVAALFGGWKEKHLSQNLQAVDLSRCHLLAGLALEALLAHCGRTLRKLNISGWRLVPQEALEALPRAAQGLEALDVSWCREVDDFFVKDLLTECAGGAGRGSGIKDIDLWGCNRLTINCPRRWGVNVRGVEMHSL
jgi:DNA repair protein RAD7